MKSLILHEKIEHLIYIVRGHKVMLDRDLASLYGVKPIRLREQVKRNRGRFPLDFMFQLTNEEADRMVSQNAIPSRKHLGGYLPYVFTEHGATMLASVLNSPRAVQMSIYVVRAFVRLREMIATHKDLVRRLKALEKKYNTKFRVVFDAIRELMGPPEKQRRRIGFRG